MELSPFNKAMKEFWEILFSDSSIPEHSKQSFLVDFGMFTYQSKLDKNERDQFSIHMADQNITRQVQQWHSLKQVWDQTRPIFLLTLLG